MSKSVDFETLFERYHQPVHCPADLVSRIQCDAIRQQQYATSGSLWSFMSRLHGHGLRVCRSWKGSTGLGFGALSTLAVLAYFTFPSLETLEPVLGKVSIEVALLDEISPQMLSIASADDIVDFLIDDL